MPCRRLPARQANPADTEGAVRCRYPILNKPWVLSQWFKIAKPTEEYFLVLDSDMIIHRPFLPEQHQVGPGE